MHINVIGAGLAGCEAAMQIASRGIKVHLYEMKPNKKTPAHHTEKYAELVCSNSFERRDAQTRFFPYEVCRCLQSSCRRSACR